jgi:hypothetical protein
MAVKYGNPIAAHPARVIARITPSRIPEILEPLSNDIFTPHDTRVAALSSDVRSLRVSATAPSILVVVVAHAEVFAKLHGPMSASGQKRDLLAWGQKAHPTTAETNWSTWDRSVNYSFRAIECFEFPN